MTGPAGTSDGFSADGWDNACNWYRLPADLSPLRRRQLQDLAINAVLQRAKELLRHAARPPQLQEICWPEEGELDLERSLDADPLLQHPQDLRLLRTQPRQLDLVAILDISLSMTGEKLALMAVAAAILKLKLENLSVVSFDTTGHCLVRVGENVSPRTLVRRILELPAQGYTNIEVGLQEALRQLRRSRERERVGLLMTDGIANMGGDPALVAGRFPRLHVIHLGDHQPQGARCCKAIATAGRGRIYRATRYADLPLVVRRAVRELFRS